MAVAWCAKACEPASADSSSSPPTPFRALAYAATAAICVYGFSLRPDTRAKKWARHEALAREKNGAGPITAEVGSTVFADTNAWKKSSVGAVPTRGDSEEDDDDDEDDD